MSREEAAARVLTVQVGDDPWTFGSPDKDPYLKDASEILEAADAYDAAHNVHRLVLSDATVERAARALDPKAWDETAIMFVAHGQSPEDARASRQNYARTDARRVLAAAVKEER